MHTRTVRPIFSHSETHRTKLIIPRISYNYLRSAYSRQCSGLARAPTPPRQKSWSHPRPPQQLFRIASPERFCSHLVLSATIKKRESIVPETIKKRLESYPGWSDLVMRRKKRHHCVTLHRLQYDTKSYKTAEKGCFAGNNCHTTSASGKTSQKVADLLG